MTYKIQKTPLAVLSAESTEKLLARIDRFRALAADVVQEYSAILVILKSRGVHDGFMDHPVLRFFQSIADGSLNPEAAILLANQNTIKAILPLPRDRQLEIARGELVPVATRTASGEIRSDDLPIHRMDEATLRRAFSPDGIRPVHEQADLIRAEGKIERIGMITVLRDEQLLKVGNQKIRPEDLRGPLAALGYSLELARNVTRKAG